MSLLSPARAASGRYLVIDTSEWLVIVAFTTLTLDAMFGTLMAATFLLAGGLLVASDLRASLRALVAGSLVMVLPAYCLVSTLWSQFPAITLRYAVQLSVTILVAVVIAGRVSPRLLMRALFITYWLGIFASLAIGHHPGGDPWSGIFGSKNAFAAYIVVFALTCQAVAMDAGSSRLFRLAAWLGLLISGPLLVKAESAGAIAAVVPCMLAMVLVMASRRLGPAQKLFVGVVGALIMAAAAVYILANHQAIMSAALSDAGKDVTLTGRTDLWAGGLQFIAEHPWLGVGYRAFWVEGYAPAEQFWQMFGVPSGAGFNFHDLYISNTVELGLIGVSIEVMLIFGGLILCGVLALVRPSPVSALLLGLQLLLVLRSFIEVEVFFEFSIRTIVSVCTVLYAWRGVREWHRRRLRQVQIGEARQALRDRYLRDAWRQKQAGMRDARA